MKRFMSVLCAGSIGLSFALTPITPSVAAPMVPQIDAPSNVQMVKVQKRKVVKRKVVKRRVIKRGATKRRATTRQVIKRRAVTRRARPIIRHHQVRRGYWHGHRGYSHQRPGYRRHSDGFWYPLAAFGLGAVVGGAIASPAPAYGGDAHVQWCYDHYRSYRASDNTFQPYVGPRKACVSPYY